MGAGQDGGEGVFREVTCSEGVGAGQDEGEGVFREVTCSEGVVRGGKGALDTAV